ncbi:MAG TPA: DNA-processing protein DprA [Chloroflexi bacterium]|nr:DNA-processing protein DprA [Chloroflexota bacterium]
MNIPVPNLDTQAILLLCGRFGKKDIPSASPLTVTEYSQLAQWLWSQKMRPADLLQTGWLERLRDFKHKKITIDRLQILLNRGGAMALAVESWTNKGLWILTRSDPDYPKRLKDKLKQAAPPILYGVGNKALLNRGGLGVVGSRNVDEAGQSFTREVAALCVDLHTPIISGGARGVDRDAMLTALEKGGTVMGVLANGLAQEAVSKKYRQALRDGKLTLISPYNPEARFTVGNAMGRNKYIYALSDACLVVASDTTGGTWHGATENLKKRWVPLLVRSESGIPEGNKRLLQRGGNSVDLETFANAPAKFQTWLGEFPLSPAPEPTPTQSTLWVTESARHPQLSIAETTADYRPEPEAKPVLSPPGDEETSVNAKLESAIPPPPTAGIDPLEKNDPPDAKQPRKPSLPADYTEAVDLFDVIWPYLAHALKEPRIEADLITQFELRTGQMRDWLKKGIEQEKVEKLKRPTRYVLAQQLN